MVQKTLATTIAGSSLRRPVTGARQPGTISVAGSAPAPFMETAVTLRGSMDARVAELQALLSQPRSTEVTERVLRIVRELFVLQQHGQAILNTGARGTEIVALNTSLNRVRTILPRANAKLSAWRAQALAEEAAAQTGAGIPAGAVIVDVMPAGVTPEPPSEAAATLVASAEQLRDTLRQQLNLLASLTPEGTTAEIREQAAALAQSARSFVAQGRPAEVAEETWQQLSRLAQSVQSEAARLAATGIWQRVRPYVPWAAAGVGALLLLRALSHGR